MGQITNLQGTRNRKAGQGIRRRRKFGFHMGRPRQEDLPLQNCKSEDGFLPGATVRLFWTEGDTWPFRSLNIKQMHRRN